MNRFYPCLPVLRNTSVETLTPLYLGSQVILCSFRFSVTRTIAPDARYLLASRAAALYDGRCALGVGRKYPPGHALRLLPGDIQPMNQSRTPVDWLIVIVNVPALLLGLAIGWSWILEAADHYRAQDNSPNIRFGMTIGFIMSYLVWNTVVMTYLILKRQPSTAGVHSEETVPFHAPPALQRRVKPPTEATHATPPPIRVRSGSPPAAPVPDRVKHLAEVPAAGRDLAAEPNPPPMALLPADHSAEDEASKKENS
jgi:hypothetical protein